MPPSLNYPYTSQDAQSLLDIATTALDDIECLQVEGNWYSHVNDIIILDWMMLILNNNVIIDNENLLIDILIDETHCPQTRSLTKPSDSKPVTLLHAVPKHDIPSDDLWVDGWINVTLSLSLSLSLSEEVELMMEQKKPELKILYIL